MTRYSFVLATLLTLLVIGAASAANPPATITFRDYPGDPSTPSDKIRSDFGGPYKNGVSGVVADFVSNGNVELNLTSSTRTVYLDFSTPDTALNQSLGLNPPNLTGPYRVNLSNNIDNANGTCNSGTGLLGMLRGASAKSCLWANFTDAQGNSWAIRFGHYNYPYTSDALATRSADGLSWTLETFPTDVAVLVQIGKKTQSIQGYFFLPGKLTITNP